MSAILPSPSVSKPSTEAKVISVLLPVTVPLIEGSALQFNRSAENPSEREILGRGGFGVVYGGVHDHKPVAVKTLYVATPKIKEALKKEAAMMRRVVSPYTVQLLGICESDKEISLVMERMKESLFDRIHREALTWPERYRLAYEIAQGLWALHEQEILHRDLKSQNILLDVLGHAKLTDFGFSSVRGQLTSLSSSKHSMGTPAYKSPELCLHDMGSDDEDSDEEEKSKGSAPGKKVPYSPYSDIYAFGVILWELAAQKIPFSDKSVAKIQKKISKGEHEKIPSDCPAAFSALILDCWKIRPTERPKTRELVARTQALWEAASATPPVVEDEAPWHFEAKLKESAVKKLKESGTSYCLMMAAQQEKDFHKVVEYYNHAPVPGYDVGKVEIIYNPKLNRAFALRMDLLESRQKQTAFAPKWDKEVGDNAAQRGWRVKLAGELKALAQGYKDKAVPHVQLLPLWHGTKKAILESLFENGYANLATTDDGFFGKGIYSAYEARYAYRVYSQGALLLNWVAIGSAYPVIEGDMKPKLMGKSNYQNYDTHYVPVVPKNPSDPHETLYYPTRPDQKAEYREVVVFNDQQCLPRYLVTLQPTLVKAPTLSLSPVSHSSGGFGVSAVEEKKKAGELKEKGTGVLSPLSAVYLLGSGVGVGSQPVVAKETPPKVPKLLIHPSSPVLAPVVSSGLDEKEVPEFLRCIAYGEQDKAEGMLKKQPGIALRKGTLKDPSGREFKHITGFQYALWGLDWHMWRMLLKYMDPKEAAEQLAELESKGTAHGKHFSLAPLIEALNTYVKNYEPWTLDQCRAHWYKEVGGSQLWLPVSVVNEYCHPSRSFVPVPKYEEESIKRSIETDVGPWYTAQYNGGKLGEKFGYCRYNWAWAGRGWRVIDDEEARGDAEALQSLSKVREAQLQALSTELSKAKKASYKV